MRKLILALAVMLPMAAIADDVRILDATAVKDGGTWRFDVMVEHADTGWDHYADGWSVLAPDGTELGHRKLLHPHVNEQPFTRSLTNVVIPDTVSVVFIRAHDSVHGWADAQFEIKLK